MRILPFLFLLIAVSAQIQSKTALKERAPMYMLFQRHPGKSTAKGDGFPTYDAPVSGAQKDKVTKPESHWLGFGTVTKKKALDLKYNGAMQLVEVLKTGPRLKALFNAWKRNPGELPWDKLVKAGIYKKETKYRMVEPLMKLKELFAPDSDLKYSFETSDLRRSQLEAIALKKSLEDSQAFGMRMADDKLYPLIILHEMGEMTGSKRSTSVLSQSTSKDASDQDVQAEASEEVSEEVKEDDIKSSTSVLANANGESFQNNGETYILDRKNRKKYWDYAFGKGLPADSTYSDEFKKIGHMEKYVGNEDNMEKDAKLEIQWPDKEKKGQPSWKDYHEGQLVKDWNGDVDLVIATGHGTWFKRMVYDLGLTHYIRNDFLHKNRKVWGQKMGKSGKELAYTEFLLLEWKVMPKGITGSVFRNHKYKGRLGITNIWRPGQTWYRLGELLEKLGIDDPTNAARDANFGDYYQSGYQDDGYYGDDYDDGYYDDEDYYYAEDDEGYDDDEYSLYEEAAINLKRAREEFRIAQQLLRWKGRGNQRLLGRYHH